MSITVHMVDGVKHHIDNCTECKITKESPNILNVRCGCKAYNFNMKSVEYYEVIYDE